MKTKFAKVAAVLVAAATLTAGWMHVARSQYNSDSRYNDRSNYDRSYGDRSSNEYGRNRWSRGMNVPAGTPIDIRLDSRISTDDNNAGDAWSGVVFRDVLSPSGRRVVIPRGTPVDGVVSVSQQGGHDVRGRLDLTVRSIEMNGDNRRVNATTEPIIDGSKQAKKIGAVIGGAAVGGLLGHAIGGDKGGILGGLLGGAAGYGATRHSGRTVTVRPGTIITFTTTTDMLASR